MKDKLYRILGCLIVFFYMALGLYLIGISAPNQQSITWKEFGDINTPKFLVLGICSTTTLFLWGFFEVEIKKVLRKWIKKLSCF